MELKQDLKQLNCIYVLEQNKFRAVFILKN